MTDEQHEPVRQEVGPVKETAQHSKAIEAIQTTVAVTIKPYVERMKGGLLRVVELIVVAKAGLHSNNLSDKVTAEDILRAAVVLLHAHLEDFLRTVASALLPAGDESCLNAIPLAGVTGRPEKFFLGKLVHHRTLLPWHYLSAPFGPKSVTHVSGTFCYLCLGTDKLLGTHWLPLGTTDAPQVSWGNTLRTTTLLAARLPSDMACV
jgi:hypothetical protein